MILVFEVGQILENLQISRILHRVSIGISNGNPIQNPGNFVDFPKIAQLQKLKSRFLHEKIIFFALDFFLVEVWLWGFDFRHLQLPDFAT